MKRFLNFSRLSLLFSALLLSGNIMAELETLSEDELLNIKIKSLPEEQQTTELDQNSESNAGIALHENDRLNQRITAANIIINNELRTEEELSRLLTPIGIRDDIRNLVDIAPPNGAQLSTP